MLGKMVGSCAVLTPNHWARVEAYWMLAVEGTQRPFEPESSGPPSARVGNVPYICPPLTAPPNHDVVRAPGMVRTRIGVRLEGAAEIRHGEGSDAVLNPELLRGLVKGRQRRTDGGEQSSLQRQLVGVGVEVADTSEEYLAVDAERGAHLDDLRYLLQLRGEALLAGKTVLSGVIDCTASERVLA